MVHVRLVCVHGLKIYSIYVFMCTILGTCEDGVCTCSSVYSIYVFRCALHGTCEAGVCTCAEGWGGTHCTLDYCPQSCSGHGRSLNLIFFPIFRSYSSVRVHQY